MFFLGHQATSLLEEARDHHLSWRGVPHSPVIILLTGPLPPEEGHLLAVLLATECARRRGPTLVCHWAEDLGRSTPGPHDPLQRQNLQPRGKDSPGSGVADQLDTEGPGASGPDRWQAGDFRRLSRGFPASYQIMHILDGVYQALLPQAGVREFTIALRSHHFGTVFSFGRLANDLWTNAWWKRSDIVLLATPTCRRSLIEAYLQVKRMRSYPARIVAIFLTASRLEAKAAFLVLSGAMRRFLQIGATFGGFIPPSNSVTPRENNGSVWGRKGWSPFAGKRDPEEARQIARVLLRQLGKKFSPLAQRR